MDLVDRYLHGVKFWLPKDQRDDILAELAEDIRTQIEEREAALGRRLNEDETATILKDRGRPILVAGRFLPQGYLIGPVLFPIYRFVLKVVALAYLVPWLAVFLCLVAFGYAKVDSLWRSFSAAAFFSLGSVTLIFAILERAQARSQWLENWNPRKLPRVKNPNLIARSGSVAEIVVNLLFMAWWALNMSSPIVLDRARIRITLADSWSYFYWAFLALALGNTVMAGINLARPHWTVWRASVRLLWDAAASALFCLLLRANILEGLTLSNVPPPHADEIVGSINALAGKLLPLSVILGVTIATFNAFRIFRVKGGTAQPALNIAPETRR